MSKNKRGRMDKNVSAASFLPNDKSQPYISKAIKTIDNEINNNSAQANAPSRIASLKQHWWVIGLMAILSLGAFGAGMKFLEESANRQKAGQSVSADGKTNGSFLSALNPFVEPPTPTPTPQLVREYLYAGSSRLLTVEDANASAAPPADLAVWRVVNGTGTWHVMGGAGSQQTSVAWGAADDLTVPGDYDGDGKTDFSVFRPSTTSGTGTWFISYTSNGYTIENTYGAPSDKLVQADYDGDGRTDMAVFRDQNPNGWWHIVQSSTQSSVSLQFGLGTDIPAPADYDGDGRADLAVWRESSKTFYYAPSSGGQSLGQTLPDATGAEVVSADYDGDGKADIAVRSGSVWHIRQSSNGQTAAITWQSQITDQRAVQNDYDGDGKVDIAVWNNGNGNWYIRQSSRLGQTDELRQAAWGMTGDVPVPAFYRR